MERVEVKHEFVEEKEVLWTSCCLKTDRQALVYFGQLSDRCYFNGYVSLG